jgi:hypothetical protein
MGFINQQTSLGAPHDLDHPGNIGIGIFWRVRYFKGPPDIRPWEK